MTIEIKVPLLPESIEDGFISQIYAEPGKSVLKDDVLFDFETNKVVLEVLAPEDGSMLEYVVKPGENLVASQLVGYFSAGAVLESEVKPLGELIQKEVSPNPINNRSTNNVTLIAVTCFILGAIFGAFIMELYG
ncbi:hypothetical protein KO528_16955 [Saccharophagus degradans]|uniref:Biotin/lipoyl-containing protein n=1 Tax=Saccharophagus degradans TaxID=86304 RepID=A0AAW7X7T3_9GAMM|nr:biotin/lipoyl-containing protein [Saccharophagus degradans]MBU2987059.1 hypothetical protein [Saccharophagus degradans]MDO6423756.1 biotin/lipoyl-containing protein [Saccharophagus degradans]MDO6607836.1 biotin/lipoyl-containing protein [Saccharophagus degradans]